MAELNSRLIEILMHAYHANDLTRVEFSAIATGMQWVADNHQVSLVDEFGQSNYDDILKLCEVKP